MRIIEPEQLQQANLKRVRRSKRLRFVLLSLVILFLASGYVYYTSNRSLQVLEPVRTAQLSIPAKTISILWPSQGQTAIGAQGYGVLATSGPESAKPMASIAKVMTALAVLKKHPLTIGQAGPLITIGTADIQSYYDYVARDGSVVAVNEGEQLSEYQALQALLLPSANNIADTLARWAFGSLEEYSDFANKLAKDLGLSQTHIADASGFSVQSVSTPSDLVKLGIASLNEPILAEIVKQSQANIPVAGTIFNTNRMLGTNDIIGVKTGHTDESGGCYLLAAVHDFGNGNKVTVITAVMGAPNLNTAINSSVAMLPSIYAGFGSQKLLEAGQKIGHYNTAWGESTNIVAAGDFEVFGWLGRTTEALTHFNSLQPPRPIGTEAGNVETKLVDKTSKTAVITESEIVGPSIWWRLTHPF